MRQAVLAAIAVAMIAVAGSSVRADDEHTFDAFKPVSQNPALYKPGAVNTPVFALAGEVGKCGAATLKRRGAPPILKLVIAADGTVASAAITGAKMLTSETVDCVAKVMRTATFPAREKSHGTTATFALMYK